MTGAPNPLAFGRLAVRCRRDKLRRQLAELAPELALTNHACDRAWEMDVPAEAIAELAKHGSSVPLRSGVSGKTGQVHSLPGLDWCLVLSNEDRGVVVTILFKTMEQYERDGKAFKPADRTS